MLVILSRYCVYIHTNNMCFTPKSFCFQVSNLFPKDELDEITNELINPMKREFPRRPPTPENLYDYFISRARKNLHVVLCFSPVSITAVF